MAPSIQQTQEDARNKALGLRGAYAAAASAAAPAADQIGQTYTTAAQAQSAFAKGFSDHVQSQLGVSADEANALLAQNGSPQHVNAPQIGDVLYGLGGYNPATLLNTTGAALKGAAQKVPDTLRGVGVQQYQGAMNEGAANLAKLEAQRPGLVQTALAAIKADQFDKQKFAYQKQSDKRDYNLRVKDFNRQTKQFGQQMALDIAKFNEDKAQFGASFALDKWKATQPDYQIVGTDTSGYSLFDKGTGMVQPIPGMGGTPKAKFTPKEIADFKSTAADTARDAFRGVQATDKNGKPIKGQWDVEPQHYQQAMLDLLNHGVPLAIAQAALNRYWTKPGYDFDIEKRKKGEFAPARATKGYGRPLNPKVAPSGKASAVAEPTAAPADWRVALGPEGAGGVWRAPWSQTLSTSQMSSVARQALAKVDRRLASASNVRALVSRMQQESGGQTGIVNKWDSNWQAGTPSIGLVQTIPSTFEAHALPGYTNIWDPLDNTIAGVRYMLSRYGHIVGSNGKGY